MRQPGAKTAEGTWLTCLVCTEAFYPKAGSGGDLLAEPIQAYRGWLIDEPVHSMYSPRLFSLNTTDIWPPKGMVAECTRNHEAPGRRCGCGLYALNSVEDAIRYNQGRDSVVVGAVDLWGQYIEGECGYRAAKGKVTALLCQSAKRAEVVHKVANTYKVPVVHNQALLEGTNWGKLSELNLENGEVSEHRQREERGRSDAAFDNAGEGAGAAADGTGEPSCRVAARGARTIDDLKHLYQEGVISLSNAMELIDDRS